MQKLKADHLFLYGAPKKGKYKEVLLNMAVFLGHGKTQSKFIFVGSDFKPLFTKSLDAEISGKIYSFYKEDDLLDILDLYEGYEKTDQNPKCVRLKIKVMRHRKPALNAWAYFQNPEAK